MKDDKKTTEEKKWRLAVSSSVNAIAFSDLDGNLTYVNRSFLDHWGYADQGEVLGRPALSFWESPAKADQVRQASLARGSWKGELTARRKDGSTFAVRLAANLLVDDDGEPLGKMASFADITERKRAEEELRQSEQRFRDLTEYTSDWLWEIDENARYTYASPKLEELLGYRPEEIVGKTPFDLMPPDEAERVARVFGAFVDQRQPFDGLENTNRHKDGRLMVLETSGVPVFDSAGVFKGYRGIDRDITERKEAERLRAEYRESLEQQVEERTTELRKAVGTLEREIADRRKAEERVQASLDEKEVLLRELHHRVKNNLQVVSSLLNLQSNVIDDPHVREMFQESRNRVRSMALTHEQLYRSDNLAEVDFGRYVRDLSSALFRSYGVDPAAVRLTQEVDDVSLAIDTAIPCGLMVNELVSNCLKHAFPNRGEGEILIRLVSHGDDRYTLAVRDNGIGFPEDRDPRTSPTLGLQLVSSLADQLGGTVELDRSEGTEFRITFAG